MRCSPLVHAQLDPSDLEPDARTAGAGREAEGARRTQEYTIVRDYRFNLHPELKSVDSTVVCESERECDIYMRHVLNAVNGQAVGNMEKDAVVDMINATVRPWRLCCCASRLQFSPSSAASC